MKSELKKALQQLYSRYDRFMPVVKSIDDAGGTVLLVGGAVRDSFLNLPVKDIDIEVHGLELTELQSALEQHGSVDFVGKSFGVLRVRGMDIDWSIPRQDGTGRKPEVELDPKMPFKKAFARRDLTINAMGINVLNNELIDPFSGLDDLKNKILSSPDSKLFSEDPLRFFRVMQFVGRFAMEPDGQLNELCSKMDISTVSRERIEVEFAKLLLKSAKPSDGFRWLEKIGRLQEVLPELAETKNTEQSPQWHPEGNVFIHLMQAIDVAVQLNYEDDNEKLTIMYATLCHDLGKVNTTKIIDGRITSYGHADTGVPLAKKMLKRITNNVDLIASISTLVKYHMHPGQFVANGAKPAAYKRLANKLAPLVTMKMLSKVMLADRLGRNAKGEMPTKLFDSDVSQFIEKSEKALVFEQPEKPILLGKDLLDVVKPGKRMGDLLKKAYEIQISEGIRDKVILKQRVLK